MASRGKRRTATFTSIFWIALMFGFCTASTVQGQFIYYNDGHTYDLTPASSGSIWSVWIDGEGTVVNYTGNISGGIYMCWFSPGPTLNFGGGASASHIDAGPGSSVNLNGGSVGFAVFVSSGADVTVAGDKFVVDGAPYLPGTQLSVQNAMVTAYDVWGKRLFSGSIWCSTGATITLGAKSRDLTVEIDVKPDSDPSIINLRSNGVVPVAVLSDETVDATLILPETVQFAGASVAVSKSGRYMAHVEDVDEDGDDDMLLHFRTQDLTLEDGVAVAAVKLTGQLGSGTAGPSLQSLRVGDGTPVTGTADVYVLGPGKGK